MKNIMKLFVLAVLIVGMSSVAFAQGTQGPGDLFTVTETVSTGLSGSLMAVTPSGSALALAATTYGTDGTLQASAQAMMPNGGVVVANPGSGLTTNFNQTGVANAFGYGAGGPFMFPAGSPGNLPQGATNGGPPGSLPPGGIGTPAVGTPTNEFQQIDQVVGKYTASSGFAQNFFTSIQRGALKTNDTSSGIFTLEQGDNDMENNGGEDQQVVKTQVLFAGGTTADPDIINLVQQDIGGVGPFSSCMNCFPGNVIGVSGDTPLGTYPNGQQGGAQVLYNTAATLTPQAFALDTVSHPGP
jgi:hypothetical protein